MPLIEDIVVIATDYVVDSTGGELGKSDWIIGSAGKERTAAQVRPDSAFLCPPASRRCGHRVEDASVVFVKAEAHHSFCWTELASCELEAAPTFQNAIQIDEHVGAVDQSIRANQVRRDVGYQATVRDGEADYKTALNGSDSLTNLSCGQ